MMSKLVAAYRGAASGATEAATPFANPPTLVDASMASLSPRELDVLRGIARGASNKEIARDHGIAETTVKIHVQHVLRKLDVSSRVHAAIMATENGLL
jgi:two-component system nitrate/nitrite response regulator NarL